MSEHSVFKKRGLPKLRVGLLLGWLIVLVGLSPVLIKAQNDLPTPMPNEPETIILLRPPEPNRDTFDFVPMLESELSLHNIALIQQPHYGNQELSLFVGPCRENMGSQAFYSYGFGLKIAVGQRIELAQSPMLFEAYGEGVCTNEHSTEEVAKFVTGLVLYALGHCDEALPYFDLFSSANPYDPEGEFVHQRVICDMQRGEYAAAIPVFEATAFDQNGNAHPWPTRDAINLAWLYLNTGREAEAFAIMDFYIYAYMGPLDVPIAIPHIERTEVMVLRAQLHAANNDFEAAIADVDYAIDLVQTYGGGNWWKEGKLTQFFIDRGTIWMMNSEWENALTDYDRAVENTPNVPTPYYYRGVLYYTGLNDPEKALADFITYVELSSEYEDPWPYTAASARYIADITAELEALEK